MTKQSRHHSGLHSSLEESSTTHGHQYRMSFDLNKMPDQGNMSGTARFAHLSQTIPQKEDEAYGVESLQYYN